MTSHVLIVMSFDNAITQLEYAVLLFIIKRLLQFSSKDYAIEKNTEFILKL